MAGASAGLTPQLILASSSPRRLQILAASGLRFRVARPGVEERPPTPMSPLGLARFAAETKAAAVARRFPAAVVLAADTVVALDGRSYGKPGGMAEARATLRALAGRTHLVYTAVAVVGPGGMQVSRGFSRTFVTMRDLSPAAIAAYVRSGEAQDKAGSYAIQGEGRRLVRAIRGPFDNVVGMPMHLVERLLQDCGIAIPAKNSDGPHNETNDPTPRRSRAARRRPGRVAAGRADSRRLRPGGKLSPADHPEHRRSQRS